jgi:hypothetical protein
MVPKSSVPPSLLTPTYYSYYTDQMESIANPIQNKTMSKMRRMFAEAYVGDGVEACLMAGYKGSPQYLSQKANELLKDPLIQEAIKERSRYMASTKNAIMNREERQELWSNIAKNNDPYARAELDKFGNPLPEDHKPNIPIQQRLKATEMLAKSEGDFVERLDINTNITLQQIIMDSYHIGKDDDDMSLEDIEVQYRRVRDANKQIEHDEPPEDEEDPEVNDDSKGYSFI